MPELRLALLLALVFLVALGASGRLRFVRHELSSWLRRATALFLLLLILTAAVFYPVASAAYSTPIDPELLWFPELFVGHFFLVVFLLAWWALSGCPHPRAFLLIPPQNALAAARAGLVTGAGGWVVTIITMTIVTSAMSLLAPEAVTPSELPAVMVWIAKLPLVKRLTIIAVAMTVEEAFFRGFLQRRLGLWISSLLFAAAHFSYGLPFMVVAVFTISLIIGLLFRRTNNLLACITAHGAFDAIQLLIVLPVVVGMSP